MSLPLWILQFVLGCNHRRLTRVFTIDKRTYQICIECGQEFEYWSAARHSIRSDVTDNADAPLDSPMRVHISVM